MGIKEEAEQIKWSFIKNKLTIDYNRDNRTIDIKLGEGDEVYSVLPFPLNIEQILKEGLR